jgi:hypothetical protein
METIINVYPRQETVVDLFVARAGVVGLGPFTLVVGADGYSSH